MVAELHGVLVYSGGCSLRRGFSAAVAERRKLLRTGSVLGRRTYTRSFHQFNDGFLNNREMVTTVHLDHPDHTIKHYFSVYPGDDPATDPPPPPGSWSEFEYGLPFTRRVSDPAGGGRFLSREVFNRQGGLERTVYVRHEGEGTLLRNPRVLAESTL